MATVDSLDIQISAQVNKANASLSTLVNRLDKVSASLSGVNTRGLATLGAGVNKLSNAMSNFSNNTKTADFSRLTRNLNALSNIDAGAISSASSSLTKIANGMKAFENIKVSDSAKQLAEFANGVKQLGYSSASKSIENIPKLAAATKNLMAELSKAPKVSQNLIDMTNALAKLARTGSSSGKAADALSRSFTSLSKTSIGATKNLAKMPSIFGSIWKSIIPILGIRQLFNWGKQALEASSDLTEVQNVVDVTFGDYKNKIEDLAKVSIPEFGMSELTAKQIAGRFQAMGIAIGFSQGKMSDMSVELTKLAADMASFYNVEQEDVAKSLQSVFTGETEPLRKYGLDLTQATLKEWALNNGLNANIQSMSQAEKTMLRYQYVLANTGAAHNDFSRTADTWANQVRVLKQNFQALASVIGGTLINALKPLVKALNTAMGYVISFAKTISNALGKIFGWTYEEGGGGTGGFADDFDDAAVSAGDIADSTGTAAKNVEKIQKGLRAFDELNVINLPEETGATGGSGAGSGAGGAGGNAAGGQWTQGESILNHFESEIDNLYDLGKYIGDALTKAMDSIDWNKIYKKAENFGKGLASFLNGLISPELFGALGKTIAGSLNTALHFLNSFGTTFDWNDFGLSIASGINNFFSTFDFALLAKTINAWVQGVWTTIKTAIENIEWENIWNGVKEFLENIDLETVAIIIGALSIKKILSLHIASTVLSWIGTTISKKVAQAIASKLGLEIASNAGIGAVLMAAGKSIGTTFVAGFKALLGSEAAASALAFINPVITAITGISSIAGGAFLAITNFVKMLKDGFGWLNEILMVVGVALAAVGAVILGVPATIAAVVAAIVAAVGTIVVVVKDNWETIKGWFAGIGEWFNTNVITPLTTGWNNFKTAVSNVFSSLWSGIQGIWGTVSGWFSTNVIEPVVGFFQGLWTRVQQIFKGLWIIIQAIWIVASTWFNENVITPITGFFQKLWKDVSGFFSNLWIDVQTVWSIVSSWFDNKVIIPVTGFFKKLWGDVLGFFKKLWSDIKSVWSVASDWFKKTIITPVTTSFKTACDSIYGFFDKLWSGIKAGVISAMNAVIGGIESGINFIVKGINGIIGGFNKIVSWAAKVAEVDWGGVDLVATVSIPRIQGYELGGFPDKASLFWAGEHGTPELLGTVGGQNAVAGGAEITGIRDAIYSTSQQELQMLREQNQLLRGILEKEYGISQNDIGKAARNYAKDYFGRTGREAYSF